MIENNERDKNMNEQKSLHRRDLGRLCILGAGESGIGAALLGKQKGYDVFVSDGGNIAAKYKQELIDNKIDFEEAQHTEEEILNADEVMKSPGIPDKNEMVKRIRAKP
jgi:UDP-N-acetylmuramoylalanine--D-glutamate ligase